MAEKRSRNTNWSKTEINLLKNLVLEYESVLSKKHSNEITNKKKKEIWDYIKNQINLLGVCKRSVEEVKNKWANETRQLKRKIIEQRKEITKTGGGPPPTSQSTEEDDRILSVFSKAASFNGVTGGVDIDPTVSGYATPNLPTCSAMPMIVDYEQSGSEQDDEQEEETVQETAISPLATENVRPIDQGKPKCPAVKFRPRKNKKTTTAEDVYKKQLEVLEVELRNKKLETQKLQLQIRFFGQNGKAARTTISRRTA